MRLAIAALIGLTASSCSSPGGTVGSVAASPAVMGTFERVDEAPPGAILVTVRGDALRFVPDELTAEAGPIVFFIQNEGSGSVSDVPHNLQIGHEVPPAGTALVGTPNINPNQSGVFTVTGLEPGVYAIWCTYGADRYHYVDGMVGTLTVTP